MVKLASARESRRYGPRGVRNRAEYMNAGVYLLSTIVFVLGFVALLFSRERKSALGLLLVALLLIMVVNLHDLLAHLAGIDYRFALMAYDAQLVLVEFLVPLVQFLGALLWFAAILIVFLQEEKGIGYYKLEKHIINMIDAGAALWLLGSVHNSCQIYETADGRVQILQAGVIIPFMLGSLLFLVGAIINSYEQAGSSHHGFQLLGSRFVWMSEFGSLLLMVGGLMNIVKVFELQQLDGLRLEKLRGGAQELLHHLREGRVPLIGEEQRKRIRRVAEEAEPTSRVPTAAVPTPYKDVLVGSQHSNT